MSDLRPTRLRGLVVLAGAVLGLGLAASPAYAYPVEVAPLPAPTGSLTPGGTITLGGGGFEAGATVTITVQSAVIVLGADTADGQGVFSASVTLPTNLSAGTHTLRASGAAAGGGVLVLTRTFTVSGSDSSGGDELPTTGYPTGLLATASGSVLLVGLGVAGIGIRRRLRRPELAGNGDDR